MSYHSLLLVLLKKYKIILIHFQRIIRKLVIASQYYSKSQSIIAMTWINPAMTMKMTHKYSAMSKVATLVSHSASPDRNVMYNYTITTTDCFG